MTVELEAHKSEQHHRLIALMFTDIVGYSRMMGEDETRTVSLLEHYRAILTPIIEAHDGVIIEFIGDAVFARYNSGVGAVRAGLEIQQALDRFNQDRHRDLPVRQWLRCRIGVHLGEVLVKNGRIFGDDVNITARIEPLAEPGAVCISHAVYIQIWDQPEFSVVAMGKRHLKNIRERLRLYQVFPQDLSWARRLQLGSRYLCERLHLNTSSVSLGLAMTVATVVTLVLVWPSRDSRANYLSVTTFKNLSPQLMDDYFPQGITESIVAQLTVLPNLYLVPEEQDIGAPYVLQGSIQAVGKRLRLSYNIIRLSDHAQIGGRVLNGNREDIFVLQDKAANAIAKDLSRALQLPSVSLASSRITSDLNAYDFYLQARSYLRRNNAVQDFRLAMRLFHRALEADPGFARAYAGLCEAHWRVYVFEKDAESIAHAEKDCQLALKLNDAIPEVHIALGNLYRGTGRYQQAITSFQKAIELDSKNGDGFRGLANVYSQQNRNEEAERTLRHAIEMEPGNWIAYGDLGKFYGQSGRFREAIQAFEQVIQLTPDNANAYSNLGGVYVLRGEFQAATEAYKKALHIAPSALAYSNLGTMYYFLKRYDDAYRMNLKAVELAPDNHLLLGNLADVAQKNQTHRDQAQDLYMNAIKLAKQNLDINPKDALTMAVLSSYLAKVGNTKEAEFQARQALKLRPKEVNVLYLVSITWNRMGKFDDALRIISQILDLGYAAKLIESDPEFTNLKSYPAFNEILIANREHL